MDQVNHDVPGLLQELLTDGGDLTQMAESLLNSTCSAESAATVSDTTPLPLVNSTNDLFQDILTILKLALIQREQEFLHQQEQLQLEQQMQQTSGGWLQDEFTMAMTLLGGAILVIALCAYIIKTILLEQQLQQVTQQVGELTQQLDQLILRQHEQKKLQHHEQSPSPNGTSNGHGPSSSSSNGDVPPSSSSNSNNTNSFPNTNGTKQNGHHHQQQNSSKHHSPAKQNGKKEETTTQKSSPQQQQQPPKEKKITRVRLRGPQQFLETKLSLVTEDGESNASEYENNQTHNQRKDKDAATHNNLNGNSLTSQNKDHKDNHKNAKRKPLVVSIVEEPEHEKDIIFRNHSPTPATPTTATTASHSDTSTSDEEEDLPPLQVENNHNKHHQHDEEETQSAGTNSKSEDTTIRQAKERQFPKELQHSIKEYRRLAKAQSHFKGRKALHLAAEDGRDDVVQALLELNYYPVNVKDTEGSTPLHLAAKAGHASTTAILVRQGADVVARDRYGQTPLHGAAASGHGRVVEAILDNVETLLSNHQQNTIQPCDSLEISCDDSNSQWTPVIVGDSSTCDGASSIGSLGGGGGVTWKGQTTGFEQQGNITITLAKPKAVLSAKDRWGLTPLHWAAINDKPHICRLLLDRGADVSATDKKGHTALHRAALEGRFHVMDVLIKRGANVSATDRSGATPLHYSAIHGHQRAVRLLIKAGANINVHDKLGLAPLHCAAEEGNKEAVVVLLSDMNIDLNALSHDGRTALLLAKDAGHKDVAELLRVGGAR